MTLFMLDVVCKTKTYQVLVYAANGLAARAHLRSKFSGCEQQNVVELPEEAKYFVLAEKENRS